MFLMLFLRYLSCCVVAVISVCLFVTVVFTARFKRIKSNSCLIFDRLRLCSKTLECIGCT